MNNCENCRWIFVYISFAGKPNERTYHECRRHAPEVVGKNEGEYEYWPHVNLEDFCGDFSKKGV